MKQLETTTIEPGPFTVAGAVLDAAQLAIRLARAELRRRPPVNLSLTQLRALDYLTAHPGASLSGVADYVGVALPSASVLIDGLSRRGLVTRLAAAADRRRVRLRVSAAGKAAVRTVKDATRAALADRLDVLTPRERTLVAQAMARVSAALAPRGHAAHPHGR